MNFKLQPVGLQRLSGQPCSKHCFLRIPHARSIGQQADVRMVQIRKYIIVFSIQVHTLQCNGYQL